MIIDLKISFDLRRLLMSGAIFISDDLVHLCENCPETLCGCISQFLKSTLRELVYGRPANLSMKTAEGIFYNEQKYMSHLLLLGKFEYSGGPIFKVVLEC